MNTATITVRGVDKKEGVTNGRTWTKYLVQADGADYGTFDAALVNVAQGAVGRRAQVTYEVDDRGRNALKSLVIDESSPVAQPEPVRDRDTNGNADWDLIGLRKTRCALWAALFSGDVLKGMPVDQALVHGISLVRGAELDCFHREPAQADDGIPF